MQLNTIAGRTYNDLSQYPVVSSRPPDKSVYWKIIFSSKTYVVGTQKNRLNETVLLSTQNTCLN